LFSVENFRFDLYKIFLSSFWDDNNFLSNEISLWVLFNVFLLHWVSINSSIDSSSSTKRVASSGMQEYTKQRPQTVRTIRTLFSLTLEFAPFFWLVIFSHAKNGLRSMWEIQHNGISTLDLYNKTLVIDI
jgi:hypothetical protein